MHCTCHHFHFPDIYIKEYTVSIFFTGASLNILGLVLFSISSSSGTNAFLAAAIILGLGNITFHLAQFHISALFPRKRGFISSVFVAGFTGSAIIMYLLLVIFDAAGGTTYVVYIIYLYSFRCVCCIKE